MYYIVVAIAIAIAYTGAATTTMPMVAITIALLIATIITESVHYPVIVTLNSNVTNTFNRAINGIVYDKLFPDTVGVAY